MGKVQKSLRIEEADAERVKALKEDGESEAAAYARVIRAGLEALEEPAGTDGAERELLDLLKAQVAEKDAQIMRLQSTLDAQAAAIAAEAVMRTRRPRGLVGRVKALLMGETDGETNARD